jgi:GMP synthase (glutamine-hydrolysing)
MKLLIVDSYPESARQELQAGGASTGWQLFSRMVAQRAAHAEVSIVYPSDETKVPSTEELAEFDGLLWTGCSLCAHATGDPRVERQVELAQRAFSVGVPQFGSCWAIQIAAVAAGGTVGANPKGRELGIARKIALTEHGLGHPMYDGKAPVFDAFICHFDEVTSWPESATWLAGNAFTRVQALEVRHQQGVFWGLQYHPEYTLGEMAGLIHARRGALIREGFFLDEPAVDHRLEQMRALQAAPERQDLRWGLAVDEDILDDDVRQREFINWLAFVQTRRDSL